MGVKKIMSKKDKGERSLILRILSNRDIQIGAVLLLIAVILAFAAVVPVAGEMNAEGVLSSDDPGFVEIDFPALRHLRNATLEVIADDDVGSAIVRVNHSADLELDSFQLSGGQDFTKDLTNLVPEDQEFGEENPRFLVFEFDEGNISYDYTATYESQRYRYLSIPAGILTLIGMVFAWKGHGALKGEIIRKRMEEEAKKKKEDRQEKEDEISKKTGSEEKELDEDVIYEGDQEKRSDGSHINFMGIPSDDEGEKDE